MLVAAERLKFAQPAGQAKKGEQNNSGNEKPRRARPNRRPGGDEPFGSDVVAAPQKDDEQQAAGDG